MRAAGSSNWGKHEPGAADSGRLIPHRARRSGSDGGSLLYLENESPGNAGRAPIARTNRREPEMNTTEDTASIAATGMLGAVGQMLDDGLLVADADGALISANAAAVRFWGKGWSANSWQR